MENEKTVSMGCSVSHLHLRMRTGVDASEQGKCSISKQKMLPEDR